MEIEFNIKSYICRLKYLQTAENCTRIAPSPIDQNKIQGMGSICLYIAA